MFTNVEQINQAMTNYENLIALIETKIKILAKFDAHYDTCRGIERIYFVNEEVCVVCDDSFEGNCDQYRFEFPISWLIKSEEELEQLVKEAKEKFI